MNKFALGHMETRVMQITPEIAKEMLEHNRNRRVRDKHVANLAKMMERGKWVLSPDGISFDKAGNLINGQHRLMAVIKSGCTVMMVVTTGCDESAIGVIDQGKMRSKDDHMEMFAMDEMCLKRTLCLTAVKQMLHRRAAALCDSLSNAEFQEICEINVDALRTLFLICGSSRSPGMVAQDYGALLEAMLVTGDTEAVKAYRDAYSLGRVDGGTNYNFNVVFALKNKIMQAKIRRTKIDNGTRYNLVQNTFSAFRSARKVGFAKETPDDPYKINVQKFVNGGYNDQFVGMDAIYG